jgi:NADPH-dependent ferric siderophore reductase
MDAMAGMFFEATLQSRRHLTPRMLRLTFGGPGLADFRTTGIADEYIRLFFPNEKTGKLHLPEISEDGRWTYPDGQDAIRYSTYTIRRYREDPVEIDIDFVIHEGGLACAWALAAPLGASVTINKPRGLYAPPGDTHWQLLVADATGLPAVARILEQVSPQIETRIFLEVAAPEDEQVLPLPARTTVTWLHGSGNGVAASRMDEIVRSVPLPKGPGYVWVAGEQKVVRAIRKFVRQHLQLPPERYQLVGYWTHEGEEWDARWAALDPAIKAQIDAAWSSGRDAETVRDEYDATLEKLGL